MPRITPSEYYKRHLFLRAAWLNFPKLYALLSLHEQWQLHEFFQPSKELTKAELVAHIRDLAREKQALAHQAGKHARLLKKVFRYISKELNIPRSEWNRALSPVIQRRNPSPAHIETTDNKRYTISAVARPEVDVRLFARVLIELSAVRK